MRVVVQRSSLTYLLGWMQRGLFVCAVILLGYWVFLTASSLAFQQRARVELAHTLRAVNVPESASPKNGSLIGRVDVDRLGVSVAVVEGADAAELAHAAGHITGTALPGQNGNTAIAAHRDTFFRPLRNIRAQDVIRVSTRDGEYSYSVVSTEIVKPDDVSVLNSGSKEILTLVTCYPFYFLGAAPERFIVRAERLQPKDPRPHLY